MCEEWERIRNTLTRLRETYLALETTTSQWIEIFQIVQCSGSRTWKVKISIFWRKKIQSSRGGHILLSQDPSNKVKLSILPYFEATLIWGIIKSCAIIPFLLFTLFFSIFSPLCTTFSPTHSRRRWPFWLNNGISAMEEHRQCVPFRQFLATSFFCLLHFEILNERCSYFLDS